MRELTSFFLIQILFARFGVLDHVFLLNAIGPRGLRLDVHLLFGDCVAYCWLDAGISRRFLIVIGCTSWVANVEKRFIMSRWRYGLTIEIKPNWRKTNIIQLINEHTLISAFSRNRSISSLFRRILQKYLQPNNSHLVCLSSSFLSSAFLIKSFYAWLFYPLFVYSSSFRIRILWGNNGKIDKCEGSCVFFA